ncbi:two component system histidine kinase [Renibacterium salmoninarum ATCC 33209]|uniref:Two component system histidine kinase n=2 Tax=Renibacterium salmoninarum TaxID=1646 RepID=A9WKX6_RENSM|nr:two component system histidine kinase [Renibacterium salmoninarum ATCC 33209]
MSWLYDDPMSSPLPSQGIEVASERGVLITWWYTVASIVVVLVISYGTVPAAILAQGDDFNALNISYLVVSGLVLAASLRYCWLLKPGLGSGLPAVRYTVMLLVPAAFAGPTDPFLLLPAWWAGCFVAALLPRRRFLALIAVAIFLVLVFLASAALAGIDLTQRAYLNFQGFLFYFWMMGVMVPAVLLGGLWWWRIVVQLNHNRKAFGELSVAKERLRYAADLHDIQGHHLQVIALKTELAERVMDRDPETAKQQIHEAQILARTALEDTRALVRGYRQVAFTTELKNAAEVFEAAAISASVQDHGVELNSDQGSLFGSVMREATTNILRHANAAQVGIELRADSESLWLSISNDGVEPTTSQPTRVRTAGTGLAALAERLESAGGALEFSQDGATFVVNARIPEAL